MSKVFFIADLHLGHDKIAQFEGHLRGGVTNVDEHDEWIVEQWNSVVTKRDLVHVLGDVCFDKAKMHLLKKMKGCKHLILGNHDEFSMALYQQYFNKVHGFSKYKGQWLSHAPIHHGSLRGKFNIHGHVHHNNVDDLRYINVGVENVSGRPVSWDTLELIMEERKCLIKMSNQHNQLQNSPNLKVPSITGALIAGSTATTGNDESEG